MLDARSHVRRHETTAVFTGMSVDEKE